ncbi:MAG: hypothetical protein NT166_01710 [Candidatus Aminicenantes bacterium]|nr:hypothetical protein [Candidatus Aminicenantes bacterium]
MVPVNIDQYIVGLLASFLAGTLLVLTERLFRYLIKKTHQEKINQASQKTYVERLSMLTENLMKASHEVDSVLAELLQVTKDRAEAVKKLETDLAIMEGREKELKNTIETLERTPLAVAEHFAMLVAPSERRSAMRDYLLFGAGVVVSTVIGIIIQILVR